MKIVNKQLSIFCFNILQTENCAWRSHIIYTILICCRLPNNPQKLLYTQSLFRVQGLGFRVQGLGSTVSGFTVFQWPCDHQRLVTFPLAQVPITFRANRWKNVRQQEHEGKEKEEEKMRRTRRGPAPGGPKTGKVGCSNCLLQTIDSN